MAGNPAPTMAKVVITETYGSFLFGLVMHLLNTLFLAAIFTQVMPAQRSLLTAISVGTGLMTGLVTTGGTAHMNAMITTLMCIIRQENWSAWPARVVAQLVGFGAATFVVRPFLNDKYLIVPKRMPDQSSAMVITYEAVGGFVFATGVLGIAVIASKVFDSAVTQKFFIPVVTAAVLVVAIGFADEVSGGANNPSLALATQFVTGNTGGIFGDWMMYWAGGLITAFVLGGIILTVETKG